MSELEAVLVPLSKLRESPDNPRKLFGDLTDLADSIKVHGVLQPGVARKTSEGELEIVIGHRRFRASKLAGKKEMPVFVREMSRQAALEAMLVENRQREDVNALELADGYAKLMSDFRLTAESVAERVGVSRASVFATIKLIDLIEPAKKALLQGKLSAVGAMRLANVNGERLQERALKDVLALSKNGEPPTVRAVERLLRDRYTNAAKGGLSKRQRETKEHGADVALRRRVVALLLTRVSELVERRTQLSDIDLRTLALALAETGGEPAREVFRRRELRPDRLSKVHGAQLRSLIVEAALAPWATIAAGEYSSPVRAVAKAYGLSLAELEKTAEATSNAEALFSKP